LYFFTNFFYFFLTFITFSSLYLPLLLKVQRGLEGVLAAPPARPAPVGGGIVMHRLLLQVGRAPVRAAAGRYYSQKNFFHCVPDPSAKVVKNSRFSQAIIFQHVTSKQCFRKSLKAKVLCTN
jgi:hypothetical protein